MAWSTAVEGDAGGGGAAVRAGAGGDRVQQFGSRRTAGRDRAQPRRRTHQAQARGAGQGRRGGGVPGRAVADPRSGRQARRGDADQSGGRPGGGAGRAGRAVLAGGRATRVRPHLPVAGGGGRAGRQDLDRAEFHDVVAAQPHAPVAAARGGRGGRHRQPVAVQFDENIPDRRAAQDAIKITTNPPVEGPSTG